MKRKNAISLIIIILLVASVGYVVLNGLNLGLYTIEPIIKKIDLGLDLRGGLYVTYEAKIDENDPDKDNKIEGAMRVIRNRLDQENQHEAVIVRQGSKWIRVEIPGVEDPRELANILAQPAELKFIDPEGNVIIEGKDIKTAQPAFDGINNPVVQFELNEEGAEKFAEATKNNIGKVISIELDGNVISAPTVQTAITGGSGQITGMQSIEEAKKLANLIESGALPVPLEQLDIRTIGATLGSNALERSIKAGIIGVLVVLLFMLVYYRLPGLVADLALIVYILLLVIILAVTKVTLTLPGIAGIILSVGMAVDANIIIFERIREEKNTGKTFKASVESGFDKAFGAILDSNITTLIAGFALWKFGTGPIQGFAKTLVIGVLLSMFTAIAFTKQIMRLFIGLNIQNEKLYGEKGADTNINFTKLFRYTAIISLIVIVAGFIAMGINGINYGIDFAGGAIIYANIGQEYDIEEVREIIEESGAQAEASYAGEKNQDAVIRMKLEDNYEELEETIISKLKEKYNITNEQINTDVVGPAVGKELTLNAIKAIAISWGLILVYIWIRFELKSGFVAIIALIHDILIMFSFVILSGMQINSSFVAAVLTIIGYSINDTIVIFDRIRENMKRYGKKLSHREIVNKSINDSLSRTVNTSLTTLFTIVAVYVLGVDSIKEFSLPIIVGIIAGTYSSVFIAGPIWAIWAEGE